MTRADLSLIDMIDASIIPERERRSHIGLAVKVLYSAFVFFHLSVNLPFYGPLNYLWFCDIAMLATCLGLWTESRLILSMVALASSGPSLLWSFDLLWRLCCGDYFFHMADYMSDPEVPLPIRIASAFHIWLPILLVTCLWHMGYDRRALFYQSIVAICLLIVSRLVSSPPPPHSSTDEVNINFVYGHSDTVAQTRFPSWLYITLMIVKYWVLMYLPLHLIFLTVFSYRRRRPAAAAQSSHDAHSTGEQAV